MGADRPRDLNVLACATLILEAATIFMALVIFWMLVTERMRCLTASTGTGWLSGMLIVQMVVTIMQLSQYVLVRVSSDYSMQVDALQAETVVADQMKIQGI